MKLENNTAFPIAIYTPIVFENKITVYTNCDVTKNEVELFQAAYTAVSQYVIDHNIDLSKCCKFNIIFTYDGKVTIYYNNLTYGSQLNIAIYRMKLLRKRSYRFMLFVFIEEMLHYILGVYDETLIKAYVEAALKYILPDFSLDEAKEWNIYGI